MIGLGKPKVCANFEVASFSRGRNIKWKPLISVYSQKASRQKAASCDIGA